MEPMSVTSSMKYMKSMKSMKSMKYMTFMALMTLVKYAFIKVTYFINILHTKQKTNMDDEAVNTICNTLLTIKSDIRELKQNYKTLKDEHVKLKECFENFKTQIQMLSERIRSPIKE